MDPAAHRYIELNGGADLQGFRKALRILIWCSIPSDQVTWRIRADPDRFGSEMPDAYGAAGKPLILPRPVANLIGKVVCHSDPQRYAQLYELVWRMRRPAKPQPDLYRDADDGLVSRLRAMALAVSTDIAKMQALLRFREINDPLVGERFIAWFEPDHFIVEEASKFFVERFGSLDWTILTPKGSLWWDRRQLAIGRPALQPDAPEKDALDINWRTFYQSTRNPAPTRLNLPDQRTPTKRWRVRSSVS
jgi:probable DNA metabolism protein